MGLSGKRLPYIGAMGSLAVQVAAFIHLRGKPGPAALG